MSCVKIVSDITKHFPEAGFKKLVCAPDVFLKDGHFLYPADQDGFHFMNFFSLQALMRHDPSMLGIIAWDIVRWYNAKQLDCQVVFAPDAPIVKDIALLIAKSLNLKTAFWEYLPSGRFGKRLVKGKMFLGEKALVFNAVSLQGRCIGERLPSFLQDLGVVPEAAAVFVLGNAPAACDAKKKYGEMLYRAIEIKVDMFSKGECPKCIMGDGASLVPWTEL